MNGEIEWPREIWMAERDDHDQGIVSAVLSEHATVARFEGDTERDREFHRYVDADIYETAERYWHARVAAAYEACGQMFQKRGDDGLGAPYRALDRCRALTPNDAKAALEAVRREARAEAFNTALMEIEGHLPEFGAGDPQDGTDLIADHTWRSFRKIVLALIDKEATE